MIHWTWLLVAFFCGVVFGIFLIALCEADMMDSIPYKENWFCAVNVLQVDAKNYNHRCISGVMICKGTIRTMNFVPEGKGEPMLTSDGYCLTYYKNKNQIVISLPQTYDTATNTYEQVVDRRTDVGEIDLLVLLNIVKLIFHKEERRTDA